MSEAKPGHLCIYRQWENGFDVASAARMASTASPDAPDSAVGEAGRTGALLSASATGTTFHNAHGSWAVTAP